MLTVMSSRARRPRRPLAAVPSPTTPPPGGADTAANIQALVERIRAGELDAELPVLAGAIAERQQLLAAAQALITRASLRVGDRVRINHRARPLYLHGQVGTVANFYGQSVVVRLDQPIGRFVTGELRCPPLALDRPGPDRKMIALSGQAVVPVRRSGAGSGGIEGAGQAAGVRVTMKPSAWSWRMWLRVLRSVSMRLL
jgi:hypothetical protein